MLQRAMSVRPKSKASPDLINRMLATNFQSMADNGDSVMRPFLQDVIKFVPFGRTVMGQMALDPLFIPQLLAHVGPLAMLDWLRHFVALGAFEVAWWASPHLRRLFDTARLDGKVSYRARRCLDAVEYGSGHDD
jgi:lycopene cyclase CruP